MQLLFEVKKRLSQKNPQKNPNNNNKNTFMEQNFAILVKT